MDLRETDIEMQEIRKQLEKAEDKKTGTQELFEKLKNLTCRSVKRFFYVTKSQKGNGPPVIMEP